MHDTLMELKTEILALADVIAAAALSLQTPAADDLTQRQAWAEFGRTWVEGHKLRGRIRFNRKGAHINSPIVTSRAGLLALKEAERRELKMLTK